MKKILFSLLTLGLLGTSLVYISSCAKQAGPLNPDVNLLGVGTSRDALLPKYDSSTLPTAPAAVSKPAEVVFDQTMDGSSFNSNTVKVWSLDDTALTETELSGISMSYDAVNNTLTIWPNNGYWTNNKYYHIELNTGIRSISGKPLDGNANNIAEGNDFDKKHLYFTMGTPTTATPGYIPYTRVRIASINWYSNTDSDGMWVYMYGSTGGETDPVRRYYSNVTITVIFAVTNASYDAFFSLDAASIQNNIILTDANGAPVSGATINVTTTPTGFWNDQADIVIPASSPYTPKYFLKLRGGLSGIKSVGDTSHRLSRGFYLDGNNNGVAESSDDTRVGTLRVLPDIAPQFVSVNDYDYDDTTHIWWVQFYVPTGIGALKASTINADNFKFLNTSTSPATPIRPSRVVLNNATYPYPEVNVYLPNKFVVQEAEATGQQVRLIIFPGIQGTDDTPFDANGDGIGGSELDYYRTSAESATSRWPF